MKSAILRASLCLIFIAFATIVPSASAASEEKSENDGWVPLFNGKDFSGWYTYLDSSGKNKDLDAFPSRRAIRIRTVRELPTWKGGS